MTSVDQVTGEQWLDALLASDRDTRIRMATQAVSVSEDIQRGTACWMGDHEQRITNYVAGHHAIEEAIKDIYDNGLPEMSDAAKPAVDATLRRIRAALHTSVQR